MELIFGGNIPSRKKNKPIIRLKNGHGFMRIGLSIFFLLMRLQLLKVIHRPLCKLIALVRRGWVGVELRFRMWRVWPDELQ